MIGAVIRTKRHSSVYSSMKNVPYVALSYKNVIKKSTPERGCLPVTLNLLLLEQSVGDHRLVFRTRFKG